MGFDVSGVNGSNARIAQRKDQGVAYLLTGRNEKPDTTPVTTDVADGGFAGNSEVDHDLEEKCSVGLVRYQAPG